MRKRLGPILALLVLAVGVAANGQTVAPTETTRLLIVDETKTFLSTMRVGGLVGALKGFGLFHVDVRLANVESSWDDPLVGEVPAPSLEPYDIILVIPRGLDNDSVDWVWVISDGPAILPPPVLGGVGAIGQVVSLVFEGNVRPVGVYDDLMPSLLFGLYVKEGWMR
ncbi:MAG: hypothetical protein WBC63_08375 [Candidatus Bipolaricaulia bacterium]